MLHFETSRRRFARAAAVRKGLETPHAPCLDALRATNSDSWNRSQNKASP
jgi:hypothetical protein